jgi:dienelactone hydrolase
VATSVACGAGSASVSPSPPFPTLVRLYGYDASAPTAYSDRGTEIRNGAVIHDVTFASPVAGTVSAFLVTPPSGRGHPALLFAPGLYGGRNDDLAEAVDYARRGVVSVLIDPPHVRPGGPVLIRCRTGDRRPFIQYVVEMRRAIDVLLARDDVDSKRIGVVGFSYGSAIAAVLAGVDHRLHAAVLESARANNSRFFRDQCASQLTKRRLVAYARAMRFSDGVVYVAHAAPTPLLLQNGRRDPFTPLREARALHAAATKPKTVRWYSAGHELNEQAARDREQWLARELAFESRSNGQAR